MKKIVAIVLISSLLACQSEKKNGQVTDTLTYHLDSVKVYSNNPVSFDKNVTDTAKASVIFPVFKDLLFNNLVQENALKTNGPDDPKYKTYKELVTGYIKGYDDYKKRYKDDHQTWFKEVKITVMPQWKNYLGLKYLFIEYSGGAHPSTAIIYKNYNTVTHQLISLDSLIKPGTLSKLTAIGEKIFRNDEKLTSNQSLENIYFFDKGIFVLNDNFILTDKGLEFLYNSYEIKPYAAGTTTLLIPFSALKDILKPNLALPAFK